MIFLILMTIAYFIGVGTGVTYKFYSVRRPKVISSTPDQTKIAELEASELGIGIAINGLPGYTWKVRSGNAIDIDLLDAHGNRAGKRRVSLSTDGSYFQGNRDDPIRLRTAEELEDAIIHTMRDEASKVLKNLQHMSSVNTVIEKYDGKAVEV